MAVLALHNLALLNEVEELRSIVNVLTASVADVSRRVTTLDGDGA